MEDVRVMKAVVRAVAGGRVGVKASGGVCADGGGGGGEDWDEWGSGVDGAGEGTWGGREG